MVLPKLAKHNPKEKDMLSLIRKGLNRLGTNEGHGENPIYQFS